MASDSIQDVEDTQTGSQYTLDGEVRTEHTHNPYALPEERSYSTMEQPKLQWRTCLI